MLFAIVLFAATYVLMLTFSKYRPYFALASAAIIIISGMLPMDQILPNLDFNVLLMIAGTMGIVQLFIDSRMPSLMADVIMEKVPNVQRAAVALEICRKLKTNPVPFIIGIAVSSNLQGAATLVGDTTAILLGSALDMSFMDFFFCNGKPGYEVKNSDFFSIGIPFILAAILPAYVCLWILFGV